MKISRIHWKKFERFILSMGCKFKRESGDHRVYWRNDLKRPVIIPRYRSLPEFVILNNLKVIGVPREEYLKIIKKIK